MTISIFSPLTGESITRDMTAEEQADFLASLPPPPEDPTGAVEPQRIACALQVIIQDNEVVGVLGVFRIGGMIYVDTGTFLAVFIHNLGQSSPFVVPNNGVSVSIAEWGGDYALIEVRDHAGGTLITPPSFGFNLYNF